MALSPEDVQIIEEQIGTELSFLFDNPASQNLDESQVSVLEGLLGTLEAGNAQGFIDVYNSFIAASLNNKMDPYDGYQGASNDTNKRSYAKKDKAGNPILVNGEPDVAVVDMTNFFPSANFDVTFYDTLNREELQAIQDRAIAYGILDEETLGNEVNGVKGPVSKALVNSIIEYAVTSLEDFESGSIALGAAEDAYNQAVNTGSSRGINTMFGGIDLANNRLSKEQILSREVFQAAFFEYGKLTQEGKKAFDAQREIEITQANRQPAVNDFIRDIEDLYYSLYGEQMSDKYKSDIINGVAEDWSPYVRALVAQDKYLRADEIYNEYRQEFTVDPVTEQPSVQYVQLDVPELKEEFNVVNPVEAAKQKIMDDARDDREFVEEQNKIRDVQSSYLQYMMGNG